MSAMALTRSGTKTAPEKSCAPRARVLGWPEVLRAVQDDEARSFTFASFRAAGFTPDHWVDRHMGRKAREAMADALTRTEDRLEMSAADEIRGRSRRESARAEIRIVRRQLEVELWP